MYSTMWKFNNTSWFRKCLFWYLFLAVIQIQAASTLEIRRLSVPRWIQNGTEDSVVLDCEYVWNENDFRLVVKWFFENNLEPVYQWIPELNKRHISGVLKNRLDLDFRVNTVDPYSKFRALKISRPSIELSGKYTCLVSSLAGQDSREQIMTVFVPANEFELSYYEVTRDAVNVTCDALGAFPKPLLKLLVRASNVSPPQTVVDAVASVVRRPNGAYDVRIQRTFSVKELSRKGATFECSLELPGTNYEKAKRIAYYPGTEGARLDMPHSLSSSMALLNNREFKWTLVILLLIFTSNMNCLSPL